MENRIGFLPVIYEDELLYSLFARYHIYSLNSGAKQTMLELFRKKTKLAVPDLPIDLASFYESSRIFLNKDLETLICRHTFYNYYTNFLNHESKAFILDVMRFGEVKGAVHMKSGVMASNIKEKEYFYHCIKCVESDFEKYGETYWRLKFQLPGVLVCTTHKMQLAESASLFRVKQRHKFINADFTGFKNESFTSIFDEELLEKKIRVAEELEYLAINSLNINPESLNTFYKRTLSNKGYSSPGGFIDQKRLAEDFENYFGNVLLKELQSEVKYENSNCWLKTISRKHRKSIHPIRHVLLILFLGESIRTLLEKINLPYSSFREGPYKCLNKAADHYGERVITTVEIQNQSKAKKSYRIFKCDCGFQYIGVLNDYSNEIEIYKIIKFGDAWINKVKYLVNEEKWSYRATARFFEVDTNTIIKYANLVEFKEKEKEKNNTEIKKNEWLHLINANKDLSITALRRKNPALYAFLYRHERKWLMEVTPKQQQKKVINSRVDWNERDIQIHQEIKRVVDHLFLLRPPIRITTAKIGNLINRRSLLEKHLEKLPLSKSVLNEFVESVEDFQIRRIKYAVEVLKMKNEDIVVWKLRRIAGLKKYTSPKVEEFINRIEREGKK